jgi:hypothetical protein
MTGRCFCGNVVFEFDGPITDIEICHCSRCQLATGSPSRRNFACSRRSFDGCEAKIRSHSVMHRYFAIGLLIAGPSAKAGVRKFPRFFRGLRPSRFLQDW